MNTKQRKLSPLHVIFFVGSVASLYFFLNVIAIKPTQTPIPTLISTPTNTSSCEAAFTLPVGGRFAINGEEIARGENFSLGDQEYLVLYDPYWGYHEYSISDEKIILATYTQYDWVMKICDGGEKNTPVKVVVWQEFIPTPTATPTLIATFVPILP